MRKINRQEEPDFWMEYRRLHPKERYDDLKNSEEGNEVRHNLRAFLIQSQHGLCAYCCRKIGIDNSLNEHIRPQSLFQSESMNYDNIIASCKTEGINATCGARKENEYDESLFVSPLEDDCESKFIFYPNGQIEGIGESGEYTCRILNLNDYELQRARKAQFKICESYQDAEMVHTYFLVPSEDGMLEAFSDMIQYFYERGDFGIVT